MRDGKLSISFHSAHGWVLHTNCDETDIERDLYHAVYQNGGRKVDSKPIVAALTGALAIALPQEDFKYVSEEEKDYIQKM